MPLLGYKKVIGVLAVGLPEDDRMVSPDRLHLLETFANQIATTCERAGLTRENEKARLQMRGEQLKNSLLSSVSHDLKTPLATIAGAAGTLSDKDNNLTQDQRMSLAREICEQAMRLNKQVSNLLSITKVEAPELTLAKEDCPLEEIIGSAISALEEQPHDGRIIVQLEDPSLEVSVDESLMQQALINLLDNAIKHTQRDSTIKVTAQSSRDDVVISISDNGPGIPDKDKARVFDKFQRGENSQVEGTGLGLAICKGIVSAHGGRIWIEDGPSGGTVFKIALPREKNSTTQVA